jgi:hypothetical protein
MTRLRRRFGSLALVPLALSLCHCHPQGAGGVRFDVRYDSVAIDVDGERFSVLHFGNEVRMPHLHPLLTASGTAVTRGFPVAPLPGDATDRPNHRGLTIGAQRVKGPTGLYYWGQNFFDNDPSNPGPDKAAIAFQELTGVVEGEDTGTLSMVAHWISHEGDVWLIERRKMTFYGQPADCRVLDIDLELEAVVEEVTFGDYQSSIIALRLDLPFDEHYGGRAVNAKGDVNEAEVRGRRSPWIDWTATLRNGEEVAVAMIDHPENLDHPARWQVRAKGFFMANPFGRQTFARFDPSAADENGEHTLKRGERLRLRYRIVIRPAGRELDDFLREFAAQ